MKIGKKTWVWGGASIALAALLIWALWPEYGSGYSEAQRRNWNGMIALYAESNWQTRSFLLGEMATLASKEAPEWKLDIPKSFGDLPLEGLMIPFLKKLAEEGNGDASLELAFRAEFDNTSDDNADFSFPSLESVYLLETYLPMAVKQGREGADFLCSLFEYRKKGGDDVGVKNVKGYHAFLARMDEGDFALGKVYLYLDPNGEEALFRLAMGLRKKADCGDVSALRDSAHLALLRCYRGRYDDMSRKIWDRSEKEVVSLSSFIMDFRDILQLRMPYSSSLLGKWENAICNSLKEFAWKRSLRRLEAPLDLLGESAKKGDIHAKYLWVKYAETIKRYFSKCDWEYHLKYADELIRGGGMYSEACLDNSTFSQVPEPWFYQCDSLSRMVDNSNEKRQKEYAFIFPDSADWKALDMHIRASIKMKDFARSVYDELPREKEIELHQQESIKLIKNAAEKSDPFAMFYLSKMLTNYGEREGDGLCAWSLLKQFEEWVGNVYGRVNKEVLSYVEHEENMTRVWGVYIEEGISFQEINIVSRHGDMPGMTVQEAIKQFLEDSAKGRYVGKQKEILRAQFEKRGFKIPEDKK